MPDLLSPLAPKSGNSSTTLLRLVLLRTYSILTLHMERRMNPWLITIVPLIGRAMWRMCTSVT